LDARGLDSLLHLFDRVLLHPRKVDVLDEVGEERNELALLLRREIPPMQTDRAARHPFKIEMTLRDRAQLLLAVGRRNILILEDSGRLIDDAFDRRHGTG